MNRSQPQSDLDVRLELDIPEHRIFVQEIDMLAPIFLDLLRTVMTEDEAFQSE